MKRLTIIMVFLFRFLMLLFIGAAVFTKAEPEETNFMLWAIWCLMMVNSIQGGSNER